MAYRRTGNPVGRPPGQRAFARVTAAREALANSAVEAVKLLKQAAKVAAKKGNHAPATYILEHISAKDKDGKEVRPLTAGIDRQQAVEGSRGPTINIGWVGPAAPQFDVIEAKALPPADDDESLT